MFGKKSGGKFNKQKIGKTLFNINILLYYQMSAYMNLI